MLLLTDWVACPSEGSPDFQSPLPEQKFKVSWRRQLKTERRGQAEGNCFPSPRQLLQKDLALVVLLTGPWGRICRVQLWNWSPLCRPCWWAKVSLFVGDGVMKGSSCDCSHMILWKPKFQWVLMLSGVLDRGPAVFGLQRQDIVFRASEKAYTFIFTLEEQQ